MLHAVDVSEQESERRAERFPVGATISIEDLEAPGGEARLDHLRAAEPISWLPQLGMWLATGYRLAKQTLSADSTTVEADANLVRASLGPMMLTSDGESHVRQRTPFDPAFRRRQVVDRFAAAIEDELDRVLATLAPTGSAEVGADIATPFAVGMAGRMLGLDLDDAARINGFYEAFAGAMVYDGDPNPQRVADAARAELNETLRSQLAAVAAVPNESITSTIVNDEAPTLSDDEIIAQLRVVMFGAIETVQAATMTTLFLLHHHPNQLALVLESGERTPGACEEAMRLVPPVSFIERWVLEPIEFAVPGQEPVTIGRGEFIGVSTLAANRDPEQFAEPDRFDISRHNAATNLSFSHGRHHCIGIHLARAQIVAAVDRILALPGLAVEAADQPSGFVFRRPHRLHVTWTPKRS